MIIDALTPLAVPVESLHALPGNPRRGDVPAVVRSLRRFGQRKPIVVRESDRTVIAGNHTLLAARELGWDAIAAVLVPDDEATSKAYALADNNTSALGAFDTDDLAAMVADVQEFDTDLLAAASYDDAAVAKLLGGGESKPAPDDEGGQDDSAQLESGYHVMVSCADESAQAALLERFLAEGLNCRAMVT